MPFSKNRLSPGRRPATVNVFPSLVLVLAVERQIFYFALAHHSRNRGGRGVDQRDRFRDDNLLDEIAHFKPEVYDAFLTDHTGVPVASSTFPDMEAVTSAQAGASVATSPNNSLNESGI
jgi:hypothetical protein